MELTIKRGDIYYAELNPVIGSEQGGTRPVLIISNDIGNKHSPTVIIAPITSRIHTKAKLPTHTFKFIALNIFYISTTIQDTDNFRYC